MTERRTVTMPFRTKPSVKLMAEAAAAKQNRSLSNYIERLIELDCGWQPSPESKNSAAPKHINGYAFAGRVIKIDRQLYEDWQIQFPNLPSLSVALQAADDAIADDPPPEWMEALVAWLKSENDGAAK